MPWPSRSISAKVTRSAYLASAPSFLGGNPHTNRDSGIPDAENPLSSAAGVVESSVDKAIGSPPHEPSLQILALGTSSAGPAQRQGNCIGGGHAVCFAVVASRRFVDQPTPPWQRSTSHGQVRWAARFLRRCRRKRVSPHCE